MKTIPTIAVGPMVVVVAAIAAIAGLWNIASPQRTVADTRAVSNATRVQRLDGTTIAPAQIDATVTRLMAAGKVTGVGIAILVDGKIAFLKGYGLRDKQQNLPLTTASVMSAASFTKVAFAYLLMQLVEDGALKLDKPVYEYLRKPLPEYENYRDLAGDARYQKITARMLLSHTSGLPNWRWFTDDKKLRIYFEPGSRFAYSGEGIDLLQLVTESITRKGLQELMEQRVFGRLGMSSSSMVWEPRFEADFANGYDEQEKSLGPQRRKHASAAGSLLTTVSDFAKFVQGVLCGTGLRRETRELMLSPQVRISSLHEFPPLATETTNQNDAIRLSYGLAWGLYWTPYGKAFFKEGHDDGWRNYTVCFEEKKMGVVIMTNSSNGEGIYKELLETVQRNTFTPIEWEQFTPYNITQR
jgi:CubicO group peptidase (beta-lactamase class C family)